MSRSTDDTTLSRAALASYETGNASALYFAGFESAFKIGQKQPQGGRYPDPHDEFKGAL